MSSHRIDLRVCVAPGDLLRRARTFDFRFPSHMMICVRVQREHTYIMHALQWLSTVELNNGPLMVRTTYLRE